MIQIKESGLEEIDPQKNEPSLSWWLGGKGVGLGVGAALIYLNPMLFLPAFIACAAYATINDQKDRSDQYPRHSWTEKANALQARVNTFAFSSKDRNQLRNSDDLVSSPPESNTPSTSPEKTEPPKTLSVPQAKISIQL